MEGDIAQMGQFIGAGLAAIGSGAAAIGVGHVAGNFLAASRLQKLWGSFRSSSLCS